jgi:hypothetical protein
MMDHGQFDALTRSVMVEGGTRRALLRFLAAGTLGGVAMRLGLVAGADAKPKAKQHTPQKPKKKKHAPQAERNAPGQLQAAGKGKGKKGKGKKKPKNPPPAECDETKPVLCQPCEEPICVLGDWACRSNGETPCSDGSCVAADACCPDKYQCEDGTCVDPFDECCPGQKKCAGGGCVVVEECCPGQKWCPGGYCIPQEECCPGGIPPLCSACERVVCEGGDYVCRPNPFLKACPDGSCVALHACCTGEPGCCPAGIAMVCPPVPASQWPMPGGETFPLPAGCCPLSHYGINHPHAPSHAGEPYCSSPGGAGGIFWWCD